MSMGSIITPGYEIVSTPEGNKVIPIWQPPAEAPPSAPPTNTPTTTTPVDPNQAYIDELRRQEAARIEAQRNNSLDEAMEMMSNWGLSDIAGVRDMVKGWIWQDKSAAYAISEFRKSKQYNDRFTGMAKLVERGQFMNEAQYIALEREFRNTMAQWDIPEEFYDEYKDFGGFIGNGVSVKEVDDRIASAKQFLDESVDQSYRKALENLGVSDGAIMAHLLDADRAQNAIQKQIKQAATMGAANRSGFDLDADEGSKYGSILGDQYNRFGTDQRVALEKQFGELGRVAGNQEKLAGIERDIAFQKEDILDANLLNDEEKMTASQRRAEREKNRFGGSSGFRAGVSFGGTGI
jgi:hypothetical protein